jgi:hypothetical protein
MRERACDTKAMKGQGVISQRREDRHAQFSELSINYEGAVEDVSVRTPDISPGGMFIHTSREFPEGAVLKLRFRLSRTRHLIEARAEVRYCLRRVGVGVEFVEIGPESVRAIQQEISNEG